MLIVLKRFSDDKSAEKFTGSDGVIDYAKMTEKPSIRRRRFFSLGVVSFTAFIFNLSFSIILTSAKPYLDKVYSSNIITQYIAFEFKNQIKLKFRWIRKPVQISLDCSSQPSHWPNSFSVH